MVVEFLPFGKDRRDSEGPLLATSLRQYGYDGRDRGTGVDIIPSKGRSTRSWLPILDVSPKDSFSLKSPSRSGAHRTLRHRP